MVITSLENKKIKEFVKLKKKKYRDYTGLFLVEGMHLVLESYKAGIAQELIILEEEVVPIDLPYTYVSHSVMKKLSSMDSIPIVIAICKKFDNNTIKGNKILLLDEIQDPGNLGTIIRSAAAFNIDSIVLSENCVDLYNPKTLRGTQGMFAYVNIAKMNAQKALDYLKKNDYYIYGTNVNYGIDVRKASPKEKFCLIVGNEGNGVRNSIQKICDANLYIKMNGHVESLNVGVACSILLYELDR